MSSSSTEKIDEKIYTPEMNQWIGLFSNEEEYKLIKTKLSDRNIELIQTYKNQLITSPSDFLDKSVFLIVSDRWPQDLPDELQQLTKIWLPRTKLPSNLNQLNQLDFGLTLSEFLNHSDWYIHMFQRISSWKNHGTFSHEWRSAIVEKLNAKTKILEDMNDRLKQLTITDDITSVYNHRYFRKIFSDEVDRARRYKFSVSLLMIDVDKFKDINDHYGHLMGDKALFKIGQALKQSVRRVDQVCRYGGDEFSVILPMTSINDAKDLAERICLAISKIAPCPDLTMPEIRISIGVSTFPLHAESEEPLLEAADKALYLAKKKGRNQVATYSEVESNPS